MGNVEMEIESMRVDMQVGQKIAVLREKEGQRYLLVWMGIPEGDAIDIKLQDYSVPRPLTHDIVCNLIKLLKARVTMAVITELHFDTYIARLVLDTDMAKNMELDCRPSDALAVAVRAVVPIFVDESVLESAGIRFDESTGFPTPLGGESPTEARASTGEPASRTRGQFTSSAQDALMYSRQEAKNAGRGYIDTEDLLVALCRPQMSTATQLLIEMGVQQGHIRSAPKPDIQESEDGGLSQNARASMKLAMDTASWLHDDQVGTHHLLIGLVKESEGKATRILGSLHVTPESLFAHLLLKFKLGKLTIEPPGD